MLSIPDAIGLAAISAPICVAVWKHRVKRRDEAVLTQEFQAFAAQTVKRLETIETQVTRIAVKLGVDLWGS